MRARQPLDDVPTDIFALGARQACVQAAVSAWPKYVHQSWCTTTYMIYRNNSICLSVCPSVRLSVQIRVRLIFLFGLRLAYHIWHTSESPLDNVSRTFFYPDATLTFDLKVYLKVFWPVFVSGQLLMYVLIWHRLTIFNTYIYHHYNMCLIHTSVVRHFSCIS